MNNYGKNKFRFEIGCILLFSIAYILFCNYLMSELPHLTWFDQFPLIDSYYNKTLSMSQLMTTYGEHGMFGYNILFLINVIIFKMTTFFDVYLNDINVMLIGIISIYFVRKSYKQPKKLAYKLSIITITIFAFGCIQISSGAMETQVRLGILFFVITAVMIDKILNNDISTKYLIGTICLILLSINIFGTLYSFAGIPFIFLIILIKSIKNKRVNKQHLILCITYIISLALYFIQYSLVGKGTVESEGIMGGIIGILHNPINSIESLFAYNASSMLGFATYIDGVISNRMYLLIGMGGTVIYGYAVYRFLKCKMYEKTYLPVLYIGYSFIVLVLIMVGRFNEWEWYVNQWYTVHTKLGAIGVVWILLFDFGINNARIKKVSICGIIFLLIGVVFGNLVELRRVPYERAYYLNKQPYLFVETIDQLPVDENGLTPLLHTPEITMSAINTMKEYGLSVHKYYSSYKKMQEEIDSNNIINENSIQNPQIISGLYEDGWLAKEAEMYIHTGDEGKVILEGY